MTHAVLQAVCQSSEVIAPTKEWSFLPPSSQVRRLRGGKKTLENRDLVDQKLSEVIELIKARPSIFTKRRKTTIAPICA